jgi:hypothetical protein
VLALQKRQQDSRTPKLPPPGRIALFFFRAAGEEQVTEDGNKAGSEVELVPKIIVQHALRDHAHRRDEQANGRCGTQPIFAKHKTTLVLLNTGHFLLDLGARGAAQR